VEYTAHGPPVALRRSRLGSLLRQVRLDAGLTQVDLARRLGQPQSYVSKCECGERRLDVFELEAFCRHCGITLVGFITKLEGEKPEGR